MVSPNKFIVSSTRAIRRLTVTKQHLAGELPKKATSKDIVSLVRDLAYVQWDPISIVAPSHIISLFSRLGHFRLSDLEKLLWKEKKVFEHWTPIASIVLTEDYPLYYSLMRRYPESLSRSWGSQREAAKKFLADHRQLGDRILNELNKRGPLSVHEFGDYSIAGKSVDGWSPESNVSRMLFHLLMSGKLMVVGHRGNQNVWGLAENFLPSWTDRKELTEEEFEEEAAQRAIRALGTAAPSEINFYFVRGRYQNLKKALDRLEEESKIQRVLVKEFGNRDERYIHEEDISLLERVNSDDWVPRLSLIAPFDNLISGTARTKTVFGFDYVHEQFLPEKKRKYGTYVLPILWGEDIIGRVDLRLDKAKSTLMANAIHAEPGAPRNRAIGSELKNTMEGFANFLGAGQVQYTDHIPQEWKSSLK